MKSRLSLLAAAAVISLAATAARADIVVGVAGPMTGPNAAFGEQLKRGADMAVKNINDAGGVLGQKLKIIYGDDASDPRQGVTVANKLATDKAVAVFGHFNSSVSIPASDVYNEEGVLQITPASTNPLFTEKGYTTVFRTCGRDDQQGDVAGAYLAKEYKGKKIAIIHDQTTYGKGLADATKKAANAAGLQEAIYEGISVGTRDFSALVSKLKQAGVSAIYFGGLHNEAGLIIRQAKEQGLNAQLISGDGIVTNEFWSITGPAGEGTLMTFGPDARKRPEAAKVVAQFKAENYDPEAYTLYTYAAVQVWAGAAQKAGKTDAKAVAAAIRSQPWGTVLGDLSFDAKGDRTTADYVFYVWKGGKYDEVASK